MTATATLVAAPVERWRLRRGLVTEAALVLMLAIVAVIVLMEQGERQQFSVDESRWISTSRYYWITFVDRDLFGPAWEPNYIVLTHPPVARYVIGLGLSLQGWQPEELNGRYDTDRSRDYNRRAGNIPTEELLYDARRVVLFFAVGATLLLYPIGRALAGPLAGGARVLVVLAHPLLATVWTRALAESVLAFLTLLGFWLAIQVAARSERQRAHFLWSVALGVSVGLATATKLTGALLAFGLVLFVALRQAAHWSIDRTWRGVGSWIDAALTAVLAFVFVNPLLYPHPVLRTLMLFEHRLEEMEYQALGTPRQAVPEDLLVRAEIVYRRTFVEFGIFDSWLGLPLDAPLAALGFGIAAFAVWRALRRRETPGPMALLACWTISVYGISTANLGFDSSHYFAPTALVGVVLQAVALATLLAALWGLVQRRRSLPAPAATPATSAGS